MEPEFAPEYSSRENWQHFGWMLGVMLPLYGVMEYGLFPWLRGFAERAHCESVLGVPGVSVLFYGVFVGMPLMFAAITSVFALPSSWRSIKARQFPPPGQKVHRRTRIRRGRSAIAMASMPLAVIACLVGMSIWGIGAAQNILALGNKPQVRESAECAPNHKFQRTSSPSLRSGEAAAELGRWAYEQ